MWTYKVTAGEMSWNGTRIAVGYSGQPGAKNNPAREQERGVGPIPRGRWLIEGPPQDTASHGPFVLRLVPNGVETFGRSGFLIHGDSKSKPGTASRGCIILGRIAREGVWNSGDRDLSVV